MQLTLEQYESIQNYLDGAMTPQEEKEFLIELTRNTSLKEGFEFEKELRQNLPSILDKKNLFEKKSDYYETDKTSKDYNSIRSLIEKAGNEWEEEYKKSLSPGISKTIIDKPPHKTKIVNIKSWSAITAAACVALAVVSLVWFMPKSSTPPSIVKTSDTPLIKKNTNTDVTKTSPKDSVEDINPEIQKMKLSALAKKYYTKDTASPVMPDLLAMVPADYKKGDYSFREINLNRPLTRGSSNNINSRQNILQLGHYYKGLSYIETNDKREAIENLQWVIDNALSRQLKIKAQWYMALIYLKESNAKKATPLLFSLSGDVKAIPYNKRAFNILSILNAQKEHKK